LPAGQFCDFTHQQISASPDLLFSIRDLQSGSELSGSVQQGRVIFDPAAVELFFQFGAAAQKSNAAPVATNYRFPASCQRNDQGHFKTFCFANA
jgi:hypothetical protein